MTERPYVYIAEDCNDARDMEFSTPPGIIKCLMCGGNGKYRQRYIEGSMTGPCGLCHAFGFVHEQTARPVSESVLNQIAVASGAKYRRFEAMGIDWQAPAVIATERADD